MWGRSNVEPISLERAKIQSVHDGWFSNINTAINLPVLGRTCPFILSKSLIRRLAEIKSCLLLASNRTRTRHRPTPAQKNCRQGREYSFPTFLCIRPTRGSARDEARRLAVHTQNRDFTAPSPPRHSVAPISSKGPVSNSPRKICYCSSAVHADLVLDLGISCRALFIAVVTRYVHTAVHKYGSSTRPNPNEGLQVQNGTYRSHNRPARRPGSKLLRTCTRCFCTPGNDLKHPTLSSPIPDC